MEHQYFRKQYYPLLFIFLLVAACKGQDLTSPPNNGSRAKAAAPLKIYGSAPDPFLHGQISEYIRRIFQDRAGNLWLGTNGDGVCHYDGHSLTYFTPREGFGGYAVRDIVEDGDGNLWFGTDGGVCRFDAVRAKHPCVANSCGHVLELPQERMAHDEEVAKAFTRYTVGEGLGSNQVWSLLLDRNGSLWAGTEGGLGRFDALTGTFLGFPLPVPDLALFPDAYPAPKVVWSIAEDKAGNLWFATNGNGAYRYDGKSLTQFSEKEGLCNNFLQFIFEDKNGRIWFGSRFAGLSRYDGKTFTNFNGQDGLLTDFMWTMAEDKKGDLWIGTAGGGAYLHDGGSGFTHFQAQMGEKQFRHVQSILADRDGRLWFGHSGGLFRLEGDSFINVVKEGPW
jgi:ligand-binding sensor domain-containing protein